MPRYLWLRIGVVVAVIVASVLLVSPRDWRGQPRQPINLGPGPPGRDPPGPRRGSREGDRERARPHGGRPPDGAPAEGHRRPGHAPGAGGDRGPARVARRRSRRPSRRWPTSSSSTRGRRTPAAGRIELALKEKVLAERRDLLRGPGAQGDPEPRRPVRRGGADDPEAGRQPHPRPAARRPGPGPGEGAHREDRRAASSSWWTTRWWTCPGRSRRGRPPATRSSTGGAWTARRRPRRGCPTWSGRRRS